MRKEKLRGGGGVFIGGPGNREKIFPRDRKGKP